MAGLKLNHIYKVYPNGTKAVNDFTMDIEDKEFIIFVGPSGCGKSTTLRMIAGLEDITTGELSIDGTVVNGIEPKDRDIAMVFQNYALYPHMTVYDNMAFGLKLRKMPKEDIKKRVEEAAQILGLTEYLKKKPGEMSGGQRQRVAVGRAIVREPKVFLFDEPLSNLDAKLRTQMRAEILKLHQKLQTTFIYVTHDQIEAMTMGTRIVVMKDGFVQQIDTPRNLYNYPCNKFVAGFIGTPQMNFFNGHLQTEGDSVRITFDGTNVNLVAPKEYFTKVHPKYLDGTKSVTVGIRAEHISVDANAYPYKATCKVSHYEDLGTDCQVYGDFNVQDDEKLDSTTKVVMKAPAGTTYERNGLLDVSLDISHLHLFDTETEVSILPRIPEVSVLPATAADGKLTVCPVVETKTTAKGKGKKVTETVTEATVVDLPDAIKIGKGECELHVPPTAIAVWPRAKTGYIKAKLESVEVINHDRLLKMVSGNTIVYALADPSDENAYKANQTIYFKIDLKRIDVYQNGERIVAALPLDNMLEGKVNARKVEQQVEQNGKTVTEKGYVLDMQVADCTKEIPEGFARQLLSSGAGKKLFENTLQFHFSPYDVKIVEPSDDAESAESVKGIAATVKSILDYGTEKFAVCTVENAMVPTTKKPAKGKANAVTAPTSTDVTVAVDNDFDGSSVQLVLDIEKLSVADPERDIKLV